MKARHRKLLLCTAAIVVSGLILQAVVPLKSNTQDKVASYLENPALASKIEEVRHLQRAKKWNALGEMLSQPEIAGSPQGQFYLGYQHARGWGVPRNPKLALEKLLSAVRFPIPQRGEAAFEIAKLYRLSKSEECQELALQWFLKAKEFGHKKADLELGRIYWRGLGTDHSYELAGYHFRTAAEAGSSHGVIQWARLVHQGLGKAEGNRLRAASIIARYLQRIQDDARNGNRSAARSLGRLYRDGLIVSTDNQEARRWLQLAAKQGDAPAMHDLAILSLAQKTPWYTDAETIELLTESAKRNYSAAYTALGRLHLNQQLGLAKAAAVGWLEKGVASGHAGSMEELARLHWEGAHPNASREIALDLVKRGSALKHKGCQKLLQQIEEHNSTRSSRLTSAHLVTKE